MVLEILNGQIIFQMLFGGDSFTAGIGQPQEETWPQLLQKKIGKRCLNLGEDGCSNDTIYLRIKKIVELTEGRVTREMLAPEIFGD